MANDELTIFTKVLIVILAFELIGLITSFFLSSGGSNVNTTSLNQSTQAIENQARSINSTINNNAILVQQIAIQGGILSSISNAVIGVYNAIVAFINIVAQVILVIIAFIIMIGVAIGFIFTILFITIPSLFSINGLGVFSFLFQLGYFLIYILLAIYLLVFMLGFVKRR